MGLEKSKETASSAVSKVCMVSEQCTYETISGSVINQEQIDIVACTKALKVIHKTYAVTGGICTATASLIEGTVANEVVSSRAKETQTVVLGHPSGTFSFSIALENQNGNLVLAKAGVARTARPIMEGVAYVVERA